MTFSLKSALLAGLVLAAAPHAAMAAKEQPAASGQTIKGLAIVNLQAVVSNSAAFKISEQQRSVTYKAPLDQAETRRQQITNQIKPLVDKFENDRKAATPDQASLQRQAVAIQQMEQDAQREMQTILAPVALSRAYVEEQINEQLDTAIDRASAKTGTSLIITPDNVLHAAASYNLNQAVLDELNVLLPVAQLVPPQGWLPRQMREQQAAEQAAAGPQPAGAAAPAAPATSGR